jgi:hypothetical protein
MDRFKVSGAELRDFYKTETQLGKVFGDIERDLRSTDQVVCQFIVNGLELQESDEPKFSVVSLVEVETLEYLTEDKNALVSQVLNAWVHALPELISKTEKLAQHLREDGFPGLLKAITNLVENCDYLVGSMVSMKMMMGDRLAGFSLGWERAEEQSCSALKQAIVAMEKKDSVQLADILEYDLNQALQTWHESLVQIGEIFEVGPTTASQKTGADSGGRRRISN